MPAAGRSSLPELQDAGPACQGSWAVKQLACGSPGDGKPDNCLCGEGGSIPEWRGASLIECELIECELEGACSECSLPEQLAPSWLLSWFPLCRGPRGLHSTVLKDFSCLRDVDSTVSPRELAAEPHCGGKQSRRQSTQQQADMQAVQNVIMQPVKEMELA